MRLRPRDGGLLCLLAAAGCSAPPTTNQVASVSIGVVEPLPSPAGRSSTSPQLTASGDRVLLSWLELANFGATLKFAERTASGWSEPHVVASGEHLVANAADVPSVRALADGTLIAHWLDEDGPDPEAYRLPLSWSKDGGRTWSPPTNPHHDGTHTQHGFGSLFQAPGGGLGVVWLDGRATSSNAREGADGSIALWAAAFDPQGVQTNEVPIDPRVCECCQTSVAETAEGVIVAYRDQSPDQVRDIYVTRFADGRWSAPVQVNHDGWKIDGCPVNGPAVTARDRDVAVAWFTAATNQGQTLIAFSHDAGRTFGRPVRVDDGSSTGHVDVELLADGAAAVSWTEFVDEQSQVRVRKVDPNGTRSAAIKVGLTEGMQYPRLARVGNELVFTWTAMDEGGYSHVRTARAALVN